MSKCREDFPFTRCNSIPNELLTLETQQKQRGFQIKKSTIQQAGWGIFSCREETIPVGARLFDYNGYFVSSGEYYNLVSLVCTGVDLPFNYKCQPVVLVGSPGSLGPYINDFRGSGLKRCNVRLQVDWSKLDIKTNKIEPGKKTHISLHNQ